MNIAFHLLTLLSFPFLIEASKKRGQIKPLLNFDISEDPPVELIDSGSSNFFLSLRDVENPLAESGLAAGFAAADETQIQSEMRKLLLYRIQRILFSSAFIFASEFIFSRASSPDNAILSNEAITTGLHLYAMIDFLINMYDLLLGFYSARLRALPGFKSKMLHLLWFTDMIPFYLILAYEPRLIKNFPALLFFLFINYVYWAMLEVFAGRYIPGAPNFR